MNQREESNCLNYFDWDINCAGNNDDSFVNTSSLMELDQPEGNFKNSFGNLDRVKEPLRKIELPILLDSNIWNTELRKDSSESNEDFNFKFEELRRKSESSGNSTLTTTQIDLSSPQESPIKKNLNSFSDDSVHSQSADSKASYSNSNAYSSTQPNWNTNFNFLPPNPKPNLTPVLQKCAYPSEYFGLACHDGNRNFIGKTNNSYHVDNFNIYNSNMNCSPINPGYTNFNNQNNNQSTSNQTNTRVTTTNFVNLINTTEPREYFPKQRGKNLDDASKRINIDHIIRGKDKRTTLMIRHIPNKYKLNTILEDINKHFEGKYDLFYLPLDFENNCNLGYAFINFVDSFHIIQFFDIFRGKKWPKFKSDKICELAYAKFQGKKDLIAHFEKGSAMSFDSDDKKPLILPTPDPLPLVSIPTKYFLEFTTMYPWAKYDIHRDKIVVHSLYGF